MGAPRRIAVASGKGGTGKTTLAVSLALSLARSRHLRADPPPLLLDCDVEAPDAHLFLHPDVERTVPVTVPVPEVLTDRCTLCGDCVSRCRFNALALLGDQVHVFPELCHGCGSCVTGCPEQAIREVPRELGRLEAGQGSGVAFAQGVLNVGEAMAVPVIRALKAWAAPAAAQTVILDAPPGTSCPVVETLEGADYVLLVTEPTPFGLHDLELAHEVTRALGLPAGVVVNRDGNGYPPLDDFCSAHGIPIVLRIPYERAIAEAIARGRNLVDVHPELEPALLRLVLGPEHGSRPAPAPADTGVASRGAGAP